MTKDKILEVLKEYENYILDDGINEDIADDLCKIDNSIPVMPTDDEIEKASENEIDPGIVVDFYGRSGTAHRRRLWSYGVKWLRDRIPSAPDKRDEMLQAKSFRENPVTYLLSNAIRHMNDEQIKLLAISLLARIPKINQLESEIEKLKS